MNVFFVGMATQYKFELRGRNQFPNHMLDIIPHDTLCGGEVTNSHHHNPTLRIT